MSESEASEMAGSVEGGAEHGDAHGDEHARGELSFEDIALRAYEIHLSGTGGDDTENWLRAERELLARTGAETGPEDEDGLDSEEEPVEEMRAFV